MNLLDDLEAMIGTEYLIEDELLALKIATEINSNLKLHEQPCSNKIVLIK